MIQIGGKPALETYDNKVNDRHGQGPAPLFLRLLNSLTANPTSRAMDLPYRPP